MSAANFIALNSFPKSGNTWVRTFLAHLLFGGDVNAIPDRYRTSIFSGKETSFRSTSPRIYKTHDRLVSNIAEGREIDHVAYIYIIRHPLDVFLSYANYLALLPEDIRRPDLRPGPWPFSIKRAPVEELAANGGLTALLGAFIAFGTLSPNFQSPGSWFSHAETWAQRDGNPPVLRLRYEDLVCRGAAAFTEIGDWFGYDNASVEAAFNATSIDTQQDDKFYWRQKAFGYQDILTPDQINLFEKAHGNAARRLGYEF